MGGFIPASGIAASRVATSSGEKFMNFNFKPNGKFKILQLTDTHFITGDPRSERAIKNICEMMDAEKPDLVIHTGDIVFGSPAEKSVRDLFAPVIERKIPFAVALGNHDSDYDLTRKEIFEVIKSLPYNINSTVTGMYGVSNDIITLSKENEDKPQWVFYLFDSNNRAELAGFEESYGYIHFEEINWYRKHSAEFTKKNGGMPVPSLSFFHIPLPEFNYAFRLDRHRIMKGNFGEEPCSPDINSGMFVAMKEMGDVKAVICGHDHDNDYAMKWHDIFLMYGRYSGCDTVYNNLKPNGARVIELTKDDNTFRSWVRLYGGEITQNLKYPNDFKTF